MIQYPINVSPSNTAIDWDITGNRSIKFTFQGDWMNGCMVRFYDYDTGEYVRSVLSGSIMLTNNVAYTLSLSSIESYLQNDKNYTYDITMYQSEEANPTATTQPKYDMKVCAGKIEKVENGVVYIAPNNDYVQQSIPSQVKGGSYEKYYAQQIRVGSSKAQISAYNKTTGAITLFSGQSLSCQAGDYYEIYTACVTSPRYYFETRKTLEGTVTFGLYSGNITAYLNLPFATELVNVDSVKYYTVDLLWSNNSGFVQGEKGSQNEKFKTRLLSSPKIYSRSTTYKFERALFHDCEWTENDSDYYKATFTVVMNSNAVYTFTGTTTIAKATESTTNPYTVYGDMTAEWNREEGAVKLRYFENNHSSYNYLIRTNLITGEVDSLYPDYETFVGGNEIVMYDRTASTHASYKYEIVTFANNCAAHVPIMESSQYDFPTAFIDTNELAYYIYELDIVDSTIENDRPRFDLGECWKIVGDISDTTVTNNLDRQIHVGYGKYTSMTNTDTDYMSGTLSAILGRMDCGTKKFVDTIDLVQAWRKFITQKKPFLLKSQKGDVWIVYVSENPTTTYQENNMYIPTTLSFNWVEAYNIKDVIIFNRKD